LGYTLKITLKSVWADGFEKLRLVPLLVITPLTFLGGSFYSVSVQLLLRQRIAARLADGHLIQSRGLSDQRLPLELFRDCRRERGCKPDYDIPIPDHVPGGWVVDFQNRLSTQKLIT
jgi:hypothetical protein